MRGMPQNSKELIREFSDLQSKIVNELIEINKELKNINKNLIMVCNDLMRLK